MEIVGIWFVDGGDLPTPPVGHPSEEGIYPLAFLELPAIIIRKSPASEILAGLF
jgi:hypothetical protein